MAQHVVEGAYELEATMNIGGSEWKNRIGVKAQTGHESDAFLATSDIVDAWKTFLLDIHFPDTTLLQIVGREAIQYVGTTPGIETPPLWTLPVNSAGNGNTTYGGAHNANYLPKDACVFAKKISASGRNGKQYFRNILSETDVAATLSGEWVFNGSAGNFTPDAFNGAVEAALQPYMADPPLTQVWSFAVLHLMNLKAGDTRAAFATLCTGMIAERPIWNKAHR
jgi:hypothetical protein